VVSHSVVGSRVTLAHGNHINNCVISDDCFLPASANATHSVYMEGSTSGSGCSISYSVVGRNTVIGPGTQFTDTNLLPIPLKTTVGQTLVEVPMPRLGACIGHNCRIGAGLIVYPGRMVESDVVLLASPTRRVIAKNISYEESDHHFIRGGDLHARRYPRDDEYSVPATSPE
jgi:NDP-sugar pyrophosphorylase family protein